MYSRGYRVTLCTCPARGNECGDAFEAQELGQAMLERGEVGLEVGYHGARPVHQIISMIKLIRTSMLSTKNSHSLPSPFGTCPACGDECGDALVAQELGQIVLERAAVGLEVDGARPVHQITSIIKWTRTSMLSIKNSRSVQPVRYQPSLWG